MNTNNATVPLTPHRLTLSRLAVVILLDVIEAPGWAKTSSDIVTAGGLVLFLEPVTRDAPDTVKHARTQRQALSEEWARYMHPIDFSDRQRDAIRKALTAARDSGRLSMGLATAELFESFTVE